LSALIEGRLLKGEFVNSLAGETVVQKLLVSALS